MVIRIRNRLLFGDEDDEDVAGSSHLTPKRVRRDFSWDEQRQENAYDGLEGEEEEEEELTEYVGELEYVEEEDDEDYYYQNEDETEEAHVEGINIDDQDEDDHIDTSDEQHPHSETMKFTSNYPRAFDCPICYEPLTVPVYQCHPNGHTTCAECRPNLRRCPSCSSSDFFPNRALDDILKTSITSCRNSKYGCKKTMTYDKKRPHERKCIHTPCYCPHSGCDFVASRSDLYDHFYDNRIHTGYSTRFSFDTNFSLTLVKSEKTRVLQESNGRTMFILYNQVIEGVGNALRISCLQPSFLKGCYYELTAKINGQYHKLMSYAKSNPNNGFDEEPSLVTGFLLIPDHPSSHNRLEINLSICSKRHSDSGEDPSKY